MRPTTHMSRRVFLLIILENSLKSWVVTQAPLRETPGGRKLCDMPFGAIVSPTGNKQTIVYSNQLTEWVELVYATSLREYRGWTYYAFLEAYDPIDHPQIVTIPNQLPNRPAQYCMMFDQLQVNLCGELAVCYVARVPRLDDMLASWQEHDALTFKRIFWGNRSHVTGLPDLQSMLSTYAYPAPSVRLDAGLRDPILERALVTPARMEYMLQLHQAIVGVKIETNLGRLKASGVAHWVVVNQVFPKGINNAMVEIYNPFTNEMEGYSWAEFVSSMGAPLGLWIARR